MYCVGGHSLVSVLFVAVLITLLLLNIFHYLLSLFITVVPLASQQTRTVQASEAVLCGKICVCMHGFQVAFKVLPRSNTFPTPSERTAALRYTISYYRDPLAADDGSREKHNPRTPNQVEIMGGHYSTERNGTRGSRGVAPFNVLHAEW